MVSSLICNRLANLANDYGWGVDVENVWAKKPIYFRVNFATDGLQWARQVKRVFPKASERLNWAAQYYQRTRGLHGGAVVGFEGGPKLMYHQPRCNACGKKTTTWHVLALDYVCSSCVNYHHGAKKFRLLKHEEAKKFHHVTETMLNKVPCLRLQMNPVQETRYYLSLHVKTIAKDRDRGFGEGVEQAYKTSAQNAPKNTAAAMSLSHELVADTSTVVQLAPRRSHRTGKRPRGRIPKFRSSNAVTVSTYMQFRCVLRGVRVRLQCR